MDAEDPGHHRRGRLRGVRARPGAIRVRQLSAIDLAFTVFLQRFSSYPLDLIANADSVVGQVLVTGVVSVIFAAVLLRRGVRPGWFAPPTVLIVTGIVEIVLKSVFDHAGPPLEFVRAWGNPLGVHVPTPSSFPSGHIMRVTYLAMVGAEIWPLRWTRVALAALAAITFLARIYIGDHWLSDAIAGALLGIAAGAAAVWWIRRHAQRVKM